MKLKTLVIALLAFMLPILAMADVDAESAIDFTEAFTVLAALWPSLSAGAKVGFSALLLWLLAPRIIRMIQPVFPAAWTWDDKFLDQHGKFAGVFVALWRELIGKQKQDKSDEWRAGLQAGIDISRNNERVDRLE